jgi:hypothetical protein
VIGEGLCIGQGLGLRIDSIHELFGLGIDLIHELFGLGIDLIRGLIWFMNGFEFY